MGRNSSVSGLSSEPGKFVGSMNFAAGSPFFGRKAEM